MLEPREFEGFWWLPATEGTVPGTLSFSQKDIELSLLGGFAHASPGEEPDEAGNVTVHAPSFVEFQPRILGQTKSGQPVTLERCNGRSVRFGPLFTSSSYGPSLVLVGAWYEPDEHVAFDEITVRFSDLDTWAMTSGFDVKANATEDGKSWASVDAIFTPPEPVDVAIDERTMLKVEFPYSMSGMRPVMTELHITQAATLRFVFAEPATIEKSLTYVAELRNFLALAIGRPIRVLSVHGFHDPPADAQPDPFTGRVPRRLDVEILYRLVGLPEPADRELHPVEMLFTLADIAPRFGEVVSTWIAKHEILGPVLTRYFHLIHTQPTAREQEFESLVRVLETHDRRVAGQAAATPRHRERLEAILASVPEDHRAWLGERLQYSHEPTLSQRLKKVLARCPAISMKAIGNAGARKSFVRKVTLTRNYETHLDPANEGEAARGAELVVLIYQLRALIEMTLMLDIGFTCEEVAAIFDRHGDRYRRIDSLRGL